MGSGLASSVPLSPVDSACQGGPLLSPALGMGQLMGDTSGSPDSWACPPRAGSGSWRAQQWQRFLAEEDLVMLHRGCDRVSPWAGGPGTTGAHTSSGAPSEPCKCPTAGQHGPLQPRSLALPLPTGHSEPHFTHLKHGAENSNHIEAEGLGGPLEARHEQWPCARTWTIMFQNILVIVKPC